MHLSLEEDDDFYLDNKDLTVENVTHFSMVNTNARSLCPKIRSLLDCFSELNTDLAILTETWLTSGPSSPSSSGRAC